MAVAGTGTGGRTMLIDWNGNGQIDPDDIAISLAMDEAGVFDEEGEENDDRDDLEED